MNNTINLPEKKVRTKKILIGILLLLIALALISWGVYDLVVYGDVLFLNISALIVGFIIIIFSIKDFVDANKLSKYIKEKNKKQINSAAVTETIQVEKAKEKTCEYCGGKIFEKEKNCSYCNAPVK